MENVNKGYIDEFDGTKCKSNQWWNNSKCWIVILKMENI